MDKNLADLMDMLLDRARAAGADAADAIVAGGTSQEVSVRLGKAEAVERSEEYEIGLRVFCGKRNAIISSSRIDADSMDALAKRAVAMARLAPEDPYAGLADTELLAREIPLIDIYDDGEVSADTLKDDALAAEAAALEIKGVTNSEGGGAGFSSVEAMLATTGGFSGRYRRSSHGISVQAIAGEGSGMEGDYDYTSAVWRSDLRPAADVGRRAGERAVARLGAKPPPTGQFPVIYDRRVAGSIAGHVAAAIRGTAIARGTSFLKDSMGKAIAGAAVTLTDDPLRPRGLASQPFDGEGLAVRKRVLVQDGVLQGWLLDCASARQLNLPPTGNARRGAGAPPAPGKSNWIMQSGESSRADLIAGVEKGVLVTELIGSSVSIITGDYSRGAAGFMIEGGKITRPFTEATIAGNLKDMLMHITPANDPDPEHATIAPSLRIDGMTVAGA